jgi:biuret amidohydrolase
VVYSIAPARTALLLIDAQNEYFDPACPLYTPNAATIKHHLVALRDAARSAGLRPIYVRHEHRADGADTGRMTDFDNTPVFIEGSPAAEIITELRPGPAEIVVKKNRYSAFLNTELESILKTFAIDTVIVTGLMTQYCCVTTARHAHDLDYKVIFVSDANTGPDMPDLGFGAIPHARMLEAVATSLAGGIADVVSSDEVLTQLAAR